MSELPPAPAEPQPPAPADDDRKAASDFMEKVGSWIVQSRPEPVDPEAKEAVQLAAEADAAKVPIFAASVMRRKILLVIKVWDSIERAFDKLNENIDGMDSEDLSYHFDRLMRVESEHMKSIMSLKGMIDGINWDEIEAIVSGERKPRASARLPAEQREKLRRVFKKALRVPGEEEDEKDTDPELDRPHLTEEEPNVIDADFEVKGEVEYD